MRIVLPARSCAGVVHAGDVLLAHIAAHRVQVFEFQFMWSDLQAVYQGPLAGLKLNALFFKATHWHSLFLRKLVLPNYTA